MGVKHLATKLVFKINEAIETLTIIHVILKQIKEILK